VVSHPLQDTDWLTDVIRQVTVSLPLLWIAKTVAACQKHPFQLHSENGI